MANAARNTTGSLARELQLGVDKIINHYDKAYISPVKDLFVEKDAEKGFYEIVQEAGMTPAALRSEGQVITAFDSINQDNNPHYAIYTYEKAARASMEAIDDNLYMDLVDKMAKCISTSHNVNMDIQASNILNNSTVTTWGDGSSLINTGHAIQAGGTSSNRLSPDLDLSLDAVQQAIITVHQFVNPDGNLSDFRTEDLVIPTALQFIADTILNSRYKTGSANNDVNPVNRRGDVRDYMVCRRLTGATTWFLTTDQKEDGLICARRKGIESKTFEDNFTHDTIVNSWTRFRFLVGDWRRVVGSVGP